MKKYRGQLGLLLVALIWGTGFAATGLALEHYHTLQILALRFILAAVLIAIVFHKFLKKITRKTLLKGSILGGLLYLAFLFQTVGLVYTTASKNAFLTAVNVVLVPLIGSLFLRQPLARKVVFGAVLAICGIGIISLNSFGQVNRGDLLTLVCALLFALQILMTHVFLATEEPISLTIVQLAVAAVLGCSVTLLLGYPLLIASVPGNLAVAYLGAFSTMLGFLLQTISQKYTTSGQAAVILSTEAFFGMAASVLILHEQLTGRMILGATLIFIGILITEWQPRTQRMLSEKIEE